MRGLIFICLSFLAFLTGSGDVIYWQVNENTTVDRGNIQQFLDPYPSTDDSWPAVRVKLVTVDGSSKILPIYFGDGEWEDGYWGAEIADWYGGWGTGVPIGNQSETGFHTIHRVQDPSAPEYPPEVMEAVFIMELGYNEWSDTAEDYVWKTLAESEPELYKDLVSRYMYETGNIGPGPYHSWSPNFRTTVPEPSTTLLTMIGLGLIGLMRKRKRRVL